MAELLARVDPSKYCKYMCEENGKKVMYVELQKALYGTLQAALLFWKDLTHFLTTELGFVVNPYDSCVVNKMINEKQCTIIWYVDDMKLSHIKQNVLEGLADKLNSKYGQVMPLVIHQGKVHDYLGMTIDYSKDGKVKFSMPDYVEGVLDGAPPDMDGIAITPAASNLFNIWHDADKLDDKCAKIYPHITAQLLYLCQHAQPDLQTAVAFLTTRVTHPDVNDWKKLT